MADQLPEPYGTEPLTPNRVIVEDSTAVLKEYPHLYSAGQEDLAVQEMRITAPRTDYPARRGQGCAALRPSEQGRVGR